MYSAVEALTAELTPWTQPVYRYQVHDPAPDWLRAATAGHGEPAYPWASWPGGVLIAVGLSDPETDLRPARTYDPFAQVPELLPAATSVPEGDQQALVRFVDRWGLLGIVNPGDAVKMWDSVQATWWELARLRRLTAWLGALKAGRPEGRPDLAEISRMLTGVPAAPSARELRRIHWQAFAASLSAALRSCVLVPELTPNGSTAVPVRQSWRPRRLLDVLYLALWQHATEADQVLRRCDVCAGMFFVSATNTVKVYCSPRCKNLAGVRAHRKRERRMARRKKEG